MLGIHIHVLYFMCTHITETVCRFGVHSIVVYATCTTQQRRDRYPLGKLKTISCWLQPCILHLCFVLCVHCVNVRYVLVSLRWPFQRDASSIFSRFLLLLHFPRIQLDAFCVRPYELPPVNIIEHSMLFSSDIYIFFLLLSLLVCLSDFGAFGVDYWRSTANSIAYWLMASRRGLST